MKKLLVIVFCVAAGLAAQTPTAPVRTYPDVTTAQTAASVALLSYKSNIEGYVSQDGVDIWNLQRSVGAAGTGLLDRMTTAETEIKQIPAGPQGPKGDTGLQGPIGVAGVTGPAGPQGPTGKDGAPGPQGPPGATGAQGGIGAQGAQGPQGNVGPQGPQGNIGPQGPAGPAGSGTNGPVTFGTSSIITSNPLIGPNGPHFTLASCVPSDPRGPLGWTVPGLTVDISVSVPAAGNYFLTTCFANASGANATFHYEFPFGTKVGASLVATGTGGWAVYQQQRTTASVPLPAGQSTVRFVLETGGLNWGWIAPVQ